MLIPTAQSIPSLPTTSPENTDTTEKVSPFTTQICPLALARPSSGIRMVTIVESAIMRMLPNTIPSIETTINTQSHTLDISPQVSGGRRISIMNPIL